MSENQNTAMRLPKLSPGVFTILSNLDRVLAKAPLSREEHNIVGAQMNELTRYIEQLEMKQHQPGDQSPG